MGASGGDAGDRVRPVLPADGRSGGDPGFEPPITRKKLMTCQRSFSGSDSHAGMPLFTSPLVMYQKSSPSLAPCALPLTRLGILPEPSPVGPWHAAQRDW